MSDQPDEITVALEAWYTGQRVIGKRYAGENAVTQRHRRAMTAALAAAAAFRRDKASGAPKIALNDAISRALLIAERLHRSQSRDVREVGQCIHELVDFLSQQNTPGWHKPWPGCKAEHASMCGIEWDHGVRCGTCNIDMSALAGKAA